MQNAKHQIWNTGGIQYMFWGDFSPPVHPVVHPETFTYSTGFPEGLLGVGLWRGRGARPG